MKLSEIFLFWLYGVIIACFILPFLGVDTKSIMFLGTPVVSALLLAIIISKKNEK